MALEFYLILAESQWFASTAMACAVDMSSFAVLALIPESVHLQFNGSAFQGRDGVILHFNVNDPVPQSTWSVRKVWYFLHPFFLPFLFNYHYLQSIINFCWCTPQAQGGGLAFLRSKKSDSSSDGKFGHPWLVYINGDHEYTLFLGLLHNILFFSSKKFSTPHWPVIVFLKQMCMRNV